MKLKRGVKLHGLQPQIVMALIVADGIWREDGDVLTVTSANDSRHSHTSLHYAGAAVDLRIHDVESPETKTSDLQAALGTDFDVILEADHIHLEYQPRRI